MYDICVMYVLTLIRVKKKLLVDVDVMITEIARTYNIVYVYY